MDDEKLLYDMIYWYCANIPPRPLDDKVIQEGIREKEIQVGIWRENHIFEPIEMQENGKDPSSTRF